MLNARIDIKQGLDGGPVVLACVDLSNAEVAASDHAVKATPGDRFRAASMSVDDVLELRELTALADELADHLLREGVRSLVMRPARLSAWRHALSLFVETGDGAAWLRGESREPLAVARGLLWPLED